MSIYQSRLMNCIIFSIMISVASLSYATTYPSIEFFASNNTHEINVEKAYERLVSRPQWALENTTIKVLQNNHIEQGEFENILGMYQMTSDNNITGDNTEIFYASPLQRFSDADVFSLAAQLAKTLNQESVAVFIPSLQAGSADIIVRFTSHKPGITEAIHLIHEKLPAYATAFSLHLSHTPSGFNHDKVTAIEWLGSKININEIKQVFPHESILSNKGRAYLVYKNGQIEGL